jgi:hypothetical protein
MGSFAVPLPWRLDSLIGYAGADRRGRDPSSQKGLGGAPEGGRLPSNGAVARPGTRPSLREKPRGRSVPTPGSGEVQSPIPRALAGAPGSRLGPAP